MHLSYLILIFFFLFLFEFFILFCNVTDDESSDGNNGNYALNAFYTRLYDVGQTVKDHSDSQNRHFMG